MDKAKAAEGAHRFLSTPSVRRATLAKELDKIVPDISIHALREEGDADPGETGRNLPHFYPRPP